MLPRPVTCHVTDILVTWIGRPYISMATRPVTMATGTVTSGGRRDTLLDMPGDIFSLVPMLNTSQGSRSKCAVSVALGKLRSFPTSPPHPWCSGSAAIPTVTWAADQHRGRSSQSPSPPNFLWCNFDGPPRGQLHADIDQVSDLIDMQQVWRYPGQKLIKGREDVPCVFVTRLHQQILSPDLDLFRFFR